MGTQSVLCPVCQGVLPASGREAYTPLRGRLIVTNGYCAGGCAERRAEVADQAEQTQRVQRPARQQVQQRVERPGAVPQPAPVPVGPGRGPVPLRVVR